MGAQPQPLVSRAKPGAHDVVPTGTQSATPTAGRVPGPQEDASATRSSQVPSAAARSSAAHAVGPTGVGALSGDAESLEHAVDASATRRTNAVIAWVVFTR